MINLRTPQGRNQVADLFRKDMNQPAIQMALYGSFTRYADLRDQLIDSYSEATQLPRKFFEDLLIEDQVKSLVG